MIPPQKVIGINNEGSGDSVGERTVHDVNVKFCYTHKDYYVHCMTMRMKKNDATVKTGSRTLELI